MGKNPDIKVKLKKDEKKNTSLRLKGKTLKALKVRAIEEDTSVQQIIETLIETYLKSGKSTPDAPIGKTMPKKAEPAGAAAANPKAEKARAPKAAETISPIAVVSAAQGGTTSE